MIRRPPRSTRVRSSAASDVYKRQVQAPTPRGVAGQRLPLRPLRRRPPLFRLPDMRAHRWRSHGRLETRLIAPTPVSYTHLRAHETVLDLVCRLLLEKKKTKHTQNKT